ncbi:MAG: dipeptide/oligopeptide/nickel ABC transporter ATP-binding protein [Candidatus Omnitrophica bacterium]|jgi:ABC-type glutathione transport system ATPase component|nr:dipeptide/oligopeptide/nickel ABC transporter ATP-binding protein [Candidatus Omnitrophota bacterium]
METIVEVVGVSKKYKDRQALAPVSFSIGYGQTVGLSGRSGSGKTTLAKIVCGLIRPSEGSVLFRGEDISKFKKTGWKKFRQKVQIVFQDPLASLDPKMTIGQSLSEPIIINRYPGKMRLAFQIRSLLKKVGLDYEIINCYPHQISGGQRQRVNIARALAAGPKLLICDEPLSSLDLPSQINILKLLCGLRSLENLAMLFISHDADSINAVSDKIIRL